MLGNRSSLLAFAAVAALTVAASTDAVAGPLCGGGFGGLARTYHPVLQSRAVGKVVSARPNDARNVKTAQRKRPATEAVKPAGVADAPASSPRTVVAGSAQSSGTAGTSVSAPAAGATKTCLTKEHLETGTVRFKDTCTNEWAINSTAVDVKRAKVDHACLTKENNQNGIVLFRDTCTHEWAMNTADAASTDQVALAEPR